MKRIVLTGLLALSILPELYAWDIMQAVGSRAKSLGNCSVSLCDFNSIYNNPAGIASYKNIALGLSYENRFLLKELGLKNAAFSLPLNLGTVGISVSQFGFRHYNENIIGLGLARHFGDKLRIGLKLDYIFIRFSNNYNNISTATFELGIQYNINESLCLATYIFNPINIRTKTINKEKIPIIMRLGISYFVNDKFMMCSEIEENFDNKFSFRFGIEYEIYKKLYLRSGFQLKPELLSFGFGYKNRWFTADVSAQMNQELGQSISCSLIFIIKERNV